MEHAITYLMFNGNCREALHFYADCLDGEIKFIRTVEDAPFDVPKEMEDRVFDSEFQAGSLVLKASDDHPADPVTVGSNFALFVPFKDQDKMQTAFEKLAEGGQVQFPINNGFGSLTDKFNVHWMLLGASYR